MPYLMALEGGRAGKLYPLALKNFLDLIAREIVILHEGTGVEPIAMEQTAEGYKISLGRGNLNVLVNGAFIRESNLYHGDIISIEDQTFVFLGTKPSHEASQPFSLPISSKTRILHSITPHHYTSKSENSSGKSKLRTIMDICIAISRIQDIDILLRRLLSLMCRDLPADRGCIILTKPNKKYEIKAFLSKLENKSKVYNKSITQIVLQTQREYFYKSKEIAHPFSAMAVPLQNKGKLLGIVQLEAYNSHGFSQEDFQQLQNMGLQIAVAIDNIYTYQEPLKYRESLVGLQRASLRFSQYLDREKILEEGVTAAKNLFLSSRVSILLMSEGDSGLSIVHSIGLDAGHQQERNIPLDNSLVGEVFRRGEPLLVNNAARFKSEFFMSSGNTRYRSLSCILAPIRVTSTHSQPIGVICVTDKDDGSEFSTIESNLLGLLANQLGTALGSADLYKKATIDPLTQVYVRGFFYQRLQKAVYERQKNEEPLSLLLFDLDHFKAVNDTYSHQAGDAVLKQMGQMLKDNALEEEILGRYGGEEFMVLISGSLEHAVKRGEEIQQLLSKSPFELNPETSKCMTMSGGVSSLRKEDTPHLLIERADQALYLAKKRGRNLVVSEAALDKEQ